MKKRKNIRGFLSYTRCNGFRKAIIHYLNLYSEKKLTIELIEALNTHEKHDYFRRSLSRTYRLIRWSVINRLLARPYHGVVKKENSEKSIFLFVLLGGLGDIVINRNYVLSFADHFNIERSSIYVTCDRSNEVMEPFFKYDGVQLLPFWEEKKFSNFDLVVRIIRYPLIMRSSEMIINNPELANYVNQCKSFYRSHKEIFDNHPYLDYKGVEICLKSKTKRVWQPFITEMDNYHGNYYPINLPDNSYLETMGLKPPYITLCRDAWVFESTKLWPLDRNNELLYLIKERYPEIKIVIVGTNYNDNTAMAADYNLVGKTTISELMVLLKYSLLHISCEGFSVHLRHFIEGGKSVVLFGPTTPDFYGYPENENVFLNVCEWCEWKSRDWYSKCRNGDHICMNGITVGQVLDIVSNAIDECDYFHSV